MELPLILVTNDDGIDSAGLWAAVEAVLSLGQVIVAAPDRQWSGGGRSMPPHVTGCIQERSVWVKGVLVEAYAIDASPALAVQHGVLELAPRRPSLVVSGINFGLNMGNEITISGTVGAALEAAAFQIPAIAVSLDMEPSYHLTGNDCADYAAAKAFTERFAWHQLVYPPAHDIDVLNINIPANATPSTSWRLTRLARQRYYVPVPPQRAEGQGRPGYRALGNLRQVSLDSDIWAIKGDSVVSVTPLSLDLTSRINAERFGAHLRGEIGVCESMLHTVAEMPSAFSLPAAPVSNAAD